MDFMRILQSLEGFLYEVMTWLIFYPRTMWRSIRHPVQMLRYSDRELNDPLEDRFADTLSPPLFLMLTILLSHAVEIASHQALPHVASPLGRQIMASDQNLLILRSILFAIYPLMFALRRLQRQGAALNRETLRKPFFAQCFVAAPAAFAIGVGTIIARAHVHWVALAGAFLVIGAVVWYLWIETVWLHSHARMSWFAAFRSALGTWLLASLINSVISFVILGT
ncbi:hypothetical protein [Sphingomonas montanisoli]|uniref:MFS transporter permease n=1 Tax=Sphingomonas montanisoli TaxID=2606412 RepID=A0A5D9CCI0_9SPHN|nr:hypothetical protein [Sphingomonas montanisoli]TZG28852.1 hypothetical protein FYJ91_01540 [Sphingomonas montanisoli]